MDNKIFQLLSSRRLIESVQTLLGEHDDFLTPLSAIHAELQATNQQIQDIVNTLDDNDVSEFAWMVRHYGLMNLHVALRMCLIEKIKMDLQCEIMELYLTICNWNNTAVIRNDPHSNTDMREDLYLNYLKMVIDEPDNERLPPKLPKPITHNDF